MKFMKFGKALLVSALSAGVVLSVTSCVQSYTVGFLYVTGTDTSQSTGSGIISGFKIDHNTGKLTNVNGLPISSGGANPVRAVLPTGSRFLYVLNRGVNGEGGSVCTTADPCKNSNVTQFAVGANGIITPQETFYTQGINPIRMITDSAGSYLLVLEQNAPDNAMCTLALAGAATCGDITVFQINATTGRLQLVVNAQVTAANGQALTYFPVPANPIDFLMNGGYLLTMSGTPSAGDSVFPYTYNASSGQLTVTQNSSQPLNIAQATAIVSGGGSIYVLDNEAPNPNPTGATSQILPFSAGSGGALQAETSGIIPDDPTLSNPIAFLLESKGKFFYVANQGNNVQGANAESGIAGYFITTSSSFQASFIAGEPFGSGSGPQCIVEDPSNQFVYTANMNDSTVTGRVVDPNSGVLNNLRVTTTFTVPGPASWCLMSGRTD
jgi:6-phosphogluconolactonase (cycloisomerase 2 family)